MFFKKKAQHKEDQSPVTIERLKHLTSNIEDAIFVEHETKSSKTVTLIYIKTIIDEARLNEAIIEPLLRCEKKPINKCITNAKVSDISTVDETEYKLMTGCIILHDSANNQWYSVRMDNPEGRGIETSETETILYGSKDSLTEKIDDNILLIRRRLPLSTLKTESFNLGSQTKTKVVMLYIEGLTNPQLISIAREKILSIDFDQFLDSSQVAAFMEDHIHTVFPQFQQTDRPDVCSQSLGMGKITILVNNTPFALNAPISFFHLFQSPEDYINRWVPASFLRSLRYISFLLSITLIPLYVALTTHHYQMVPIQILFVLVESRGKLPFAPFWEGVLMLTVLEIITEASLRMPTKSSQTLGIIGGIIIGQAAVQAGFVSQVLIVLVGVSAIASFLVPNYSITKANSLLQLIFLILADVLGMIGIVFGLVILLAHLNGLTSLKQPYFAPIAPFYWKDWLDLFIRAPLQWMKVRPESLHPLQKWRYRKGR
ncbi:spore germination protein [Alteribacillus iranensis]|uniref:GerA spore germination protein n=1 Tax=Alteribacillus iranensis TaxID=930128 RepID=A0A1I2EXF7_9BACI|nr:spore germination protein [Alteribacillus iranensis]SFE97459.1 GerA spore germination protein [Alteribacillus iranensis]